ncbi:zinc finger protein 263-like [Cydia fagiglandana]|uniref:zinc finger protein 263-like n=1 Tax=Cydia fagiglandana TaxID=1458189 RepID=UPI002FEE4E1E
MGKSCCIEGCNVSSPDVEYFKFPRSGSLLAAWIEATGAPGGDVCSAHFTDADYKSMRGKRRLLGTAVPSVFATRPPCTENGNITDPTKDTNKNANTNPKNKKAKEKKSTDKAKADSTTDNVNEITTDNNAMDKDESTTDTDVTESNVENGESSQDTRQGGENGKDDKNGENAQPEVNDIEDMITNYQIKQPPLADRLNPEPLEDLIPAILEHQSVQGLQAEQVHIEETQADTRNTGNTQEDRLNPEPLEDLIPAILEHQSVQGLQAEQVHIEEIQADTRNTDNTQEPLEDLIPAILEHQSAQGLQAEQVHIEEIQPETRNTDNTQEVKWQSLSSVPTSTTEDRLNPEPLEDLIPAILEHQSVQGLQAEQVHIEDIQADTRNTDNTQEGSPNKLDVSQLASHIASKLDNQLAQIMATAPVFIEVAVDQNDTRAESPQDCLMLLESVQCDIDPSSLMLPEHGPDTDSDMEIVEADNKITEDPNPISLLTSSDEDEVIIEEPHIDTVEVSDETDEDDRPLQRLIKEKPKQKKPVKKKKKGNFEYFVHSSPYYCVQCDFRTDNEAEFIQHNIELAHMNSTTIQVCSTCNYTTASKAQFSRHKRKHRDERNFKCHLCNYKARHNMSLIYHLRCHDPVEKKQEKFTCDKCGFSSNVKSEALNHLKNKSCGSKYSCDQCSYSTKRRSDLRRHRLRRHSVDDSDEDFTI